MEPLSPPPAAAVGRGTRPRHRQRDPHLVRTGCAWRLLPKEYPVAGGVLVLPAVVGRWQPEPTARRVAGPRARRRRPGSDGLGRHRAGDRHSRPGPQTLDRLAGPGADRGVPGQPLIRGAQGDHVLAAGHRPARVVDIPAASTWSPWAPRM